MTVTGREDIEELPPGEEIHAPRGEVARVRLILPVVGVLAGFAFLALALSGTVRIDIFKFLGIYLLPGGIDYGVPIAVSDAGPGFGLEPWLVLLVLAYFDVWITLFWVWNLDHLARFRLIEARVNKSRARAHGVWQRFPWLRVATGPGLALFIMIPIPWTGSFVGIVVGKLLDLADWVIFFASVIGTAVRVSLLAFGFDALF